MSIGLICRLASINKKQFNYKFCIEFHLQSGYCHKQNIGRSFQLLRYFNPSYFKIKDNKNTILKIHETSLRYFFVIFGPLIGNSVNRMATRNLASDALHYLVSFQSTYIFYLMPFTTLFPNIVEQL